MSTSMARELTGVAPGGVAARQVTGYCFPTSGRVIEVVVDTGEAVATGDELARIDATVLQANVDGAQATLSAVLSQS